MMGHSVIGVEFKMKPAGVGLRNRFDQTSRRIDGEKVMGALHRGLGNHRKAFVIAVGQGNLYKRPGGGKVFEKGIKFRALYVFITCHVGRSGVVVTSSYKSDTFLAKSGS